VSVNGDEKVMKGIDVFSTIRVKCEVMQARGVPIVLLT
jgi:hypothetical protein